MKAIICTQYGPPEVLQQQVVEKPFPADNEVLVKVHAASITYSNLLFMHGQPLLMRLMLGAPFKPKYRILGSDVAGQVEAVGRLVTQFRPGDLVYGDLSNCGRGAFAEYVAAPESALGLMPANLSFTEAAAIPEAALVALQALRDKGKIQAGQKVLIYGASGGIGTFAVQFAKYYGAHVTGVCGPRSLELVRSLDADHVIDYTKEDFTQNGQQYDLILAAAGFRSIFAYRRALSSRGRYIATGGALGQVFQALLVGPLISSRGGKQLSSYLVEPNKDLPFVKELVEAGKIRPVIDRCYPVGQTAEAVRYYAEGHSHGKVVIKVEDSAW